MLKKGLLLLCSSVALLGFVLSAQALDAVSGQSQFDITATLVQAIVFKSVTPLTFGELATSSTKFTDTVAPTDSGAAKFDVTGEKNRDILGTLASEKVSLSCVAGSGCGRNTLQVNQFKMGGDFTADGKANFGASGELTNLRVGATLAVSANALSGKYKGTNTLTLTYQ